MFFVSICGFEHGTTKIECHIRNCGWHIFGSAFRAISYDFLSFSIYCHIQMPFTFSIIHIYPFIISSIVKNRYLKGHIPVSFIIGNRVV